MRTLGRIIGHNMSSDRPAVAELIIEGVPYAFKVENSADIPKLALDGVGLFSVSPADQFCTIIDPAKLTD